MLLKIALVSTLVSTPIFGIALQDPVAEQTTDPRLAAAQERIAGLEAELAACRQERDRLWALVRQQPRHRHNCTPSRALMTHWQWLEGEGRNGPADRALEVLLEEHDNNSELNSLAWELLTDDDFAGQFDALALATAQRMDMDTIAHNELDTLALAWFKNGNPCQAVRLQRQAVKRNGGDRDYQRRLRRFEKALEKQKANKAAPQKRIN